tara:strand:+ start:1311 stop:3368 length:2058 start_codon:yes stop_codon:yes gene_type:complete
MEKTLPELVAEMQAAGVEPSAVAAFVQKFDSDNVQTDSNIKPPANKPPESRITSTLRNVKDTAAELAPAALATALSGVPGGRYLGYAGGQGIREVLQRGGQIPGAIADIYRNLRDGDPNVRFAMLKGAAQGAAQGTVNLIPGSRGVQAAASSLEEGRPYTAVADAIGAGLDVATVGGAGKVRKVFESAPGRATLATLLGVGGAKGSEPVTDVLGKRLGLTEDQRQLAKTVVGIPTGMLAASSMHPSAPRIAATVATNPVVTALGAGGLEYARSGSPVNAAIAASGEIGVRKALSSYLKSNNQQTAAINRQTLTQEVARLEGLERYEEATALKQKALQDDTGTTGLYKQITAERAAGERKLAAITKANTAKEAAAARETFRQWVQEAKNLKAGEDFLLNDAADKATLKRQTEFQDAKNANLADDYKERVVKATSAYEIDAEKQFELKRLANAKQLTRDRINDVRKAAETQKHWLEVARSLEASQDFVDSLRKANSYYETDALLKASKAKIAADNALAKQQKIAATKAAENAAEARNAVLFAHGTEAAPPSMTVRSALSDKGIIRTTIQKFFAAPDPDASQSGAGGPRTMKDILSGPTKANAEELASQQRAAKVLAGESFVIPSTQLPLVEELAWDKRIAQIQGMKGAATNTSETVPNRNAAAALVNNPLRKGVVTNLPFGTTFRQR